jgi:hypothetical protein
MVEGIPAFIRHIRVIGGQNVFCSSPGLRLRRSVTPALMIST